MDRTAIHIREGNVALCGDRDGRNWYACGRQYVTCEACIAEERAREEAQAQERVLAPLEAQRAKDRTRAIRCLRRAHGELLTACIYAADTAHLLGMGGADALAIASAQSIHQTLLRQADLQVALLRHFDPTEPAQDLEDVEQEATR